MNNKPLRTMSRKCPQLGRQEEENHQGEKKSKSCCIWATVSNYRNENNNEN